MIKIRLKNSGSQINDAIKLIKKFNRINKLKYDLKIFLDLDLGMGACKYREIGRFTYKYPPEIVLNPLNAVEDKKNIVCIGNPDDISIYSVMIHEFAHFLDWKLKLEKKYQEQKFKKPFKICYNAKRNKTEELAELVSLYLINPFILEILYKDRFDWLKNIIKSPNIQIRKKLFFKLYENWEEKNKKSFYRKCKMKIDIDKKKIVYKKIEY